MTIAIVDDELETRQYMQGLVAQYLAETGRMAQLVFYPDGASFLVGCEHPDIVLMDIDMPGMDGLSTAEQLRRSHPDAIPDFTTRLSQCAIRGYEVDAIGFLVKPVTLPGLTVKLNKAFKRVEYRQSKICLKRKTASCSWRKTRFTMPRAAITMSFIIRRRANSPSARPCRRRRNSWARNSAEARIPISSIWAS